MFLETSLTEEPDLDSFMCMQNPMARFSAAWKAFSELSLAKKVLNAVASLSPISFLFRDEDVLRNLFSPWLSLLAVVACFTALMAALAIYGPRKSNDRYRKRAVGLRLVVLVLTGIVLVLWFGAEDFPIAMLGDFGRLFVQTLVAVAYVVFVAALVQVFALFTLLH